MLTLRAGAAVAARCAQLYGALLPSQCTVRWLLRQVVRDARGAPQSCAMAPGAVACSAGWQADLQHFQSEAAAPAPADRCC